MNQGRIVRLLKEAIESVDFNDLVKEAIVEHLEDLNLEKLVEDCIEKAATEIKDRMDELANQHE